MQKRSIKKQKKMLEIQEQEELKMVRYERDIQDDNDDNKGEFRPEEKKLVYNSSSSSDSGEENGNKPNFDNLIQDSQSASSDDENEIERKTGAEIREIKKMESI